MHVYQQKDLGFHSLYFVKQNIYQKLRNPIKAELKLRLQYLQSCSNVVNSNAQAIRHGAYQYVQLKKEVVIVPAGRRAHGPAKE